jgi:hypothetical protein
LFLQVGLKLLLGLRDELNHAITRIELLAIINNVWVARWFVPEMVKNGLRSSFVYWSLIWACLMRES